MRTIITIGIRIELAMKHKGKMTFIVVFRFVCITIGSWYLVAANVGVPITSIVTSVEVIRVPSCKSKIKFNRSHTNTARKAKFPANVRYLPFVASPMSIIPTDLFLLLKTILCRQTKCM